MMSGSLLLDNDGIVMENEKIEWFSVGSILAAVGVVPTLFRFRLVATAQQTAPGNLHDRDEHEVGRMGVR